MKTVGQTVNIISSKQSEFDDFGHEDLEVVSIATSSDDDSSYDSSMDGMALYKLKFKDDDSMFPYKLYENYLS